MWDIILFVYLLGILLSQPVYIWAIGTLCRMEDEDEELYCQDNGLYYEPRKPNYPLVMVLMVLAGIFWPLGRGYVLITGWGEIPTLLRWRKLWQLYETPIQTHYLMV